MGPFRAGLRIAGLLLAVILAVPIHYLWRLFRLPSPWPRWFLASCGWIAGARRHTIGTPLRRDVFFIANHISWLDVPVDRRRQRHRLRRAGRAGKGARGRLAVHLEPHRVRLADRSHGRRRSDQPRPRCARRNLEPRHLSEGTTSDGTQLLPFKSPLMAVLDPPPPGVLVQPVLARLRRSRAGDRLGRHRTRQGQCAPRPRPPRQLSGEAALPRTLRSARLCRPQGDRSGGEAADRGGDGYR